MQTPPKNNRSYSAAEVYADTTIHLVGVVGALLAVPVMITLVSVWRDEGTLIAAVAIYGASLLAMLGFSASYNIASWRLAGSRALAACAPQSSGTRGASGSVPQ